MVGYCFVITHWGCTSTSTSSLILISTSPPYPLHLETVLMHVFSLSFPFRSLYSLLTLTLIYLLSLYHPGVALDSRCPPWVQSNQPKPL